MPYMFQMCFFLEIQATVEYYSKIFEYTIKMVIYVKTGDESGVVYRVKSTGPSTEPCGTSYESVTLIFADWCLFCK